MAEGFWQRLKRGEVRGLGVFFALLSGVFGGLAPTFQKLGLPASFSPGTAEGWITALSNPVFLFGAILGVISIPLLIIAFSYGKASVLFPVGGGTGYITTLLSAALLLGEAVTYPKLLGVGIIILGVSLLSRTAS